jgi:hypothetical protein
MITQRILSIQTLLKAINIIIDLVMWRQNYLIYIIVFIVRRKTTFQTNAEGRRRFINEQFTIVGLALGDGIERLIICISLIVELNHRYMHV